MFFRLLRCCFILMYLCCSSENITANLKIEYGGISFYCDDGCGDPDYEAHEILLRFEQIKRKLIGYDVCSTTGVKVPTTRGTIHYAKDGVHIVPTVPKR